MFAVCTHWYLLLILSGGTVWCDKVEHVVLLCSFREINARTKVRVIRCTHVLSCACIVSNSLNITMRYNDDKKCNKDQSSISGVLMAFQWLPTFGCSSMLGDWNQSPWGLCSWWLVGTRLPKSSHTPQKRGRNRGLRRYVRFRMTSCQPHH
jgi:hypothetical protein